jgi:hypothetical protein
MKRNEEKAPRLLSPLLKMKNQATRMRRALVTAVMTAVTATKPPSEKKTLRRLTLWARYLLKHSTFVVVRVYLYIHSVVVFCLKKLLFVNFNLRRSCKLGLRRT